MGIFKTDKAGQQVDRTACIATIGEMGDFSPIVAELDGGKAGERRRLANFVAQKTAGSTRRAAGCARMRRLDGSDLPLRRELRIATLKGKKQAKSVIQRSRGTEEQRKESA